MRSRHAVAAAIAALFLALSLGRQASAASTLRFEVRPLPRGGALVAANGAKVLTLRRAPQGAVALAGRIAAQLNAAAGAAVLPGDITVAGAGPVFTISVAGSPLVVVSRKLAYANGSNPAGLADNWAKAIKQVFASAYLVTPDTWITVPLGETRLVPLAGNIKQALTVEGPANIVSWQAAPGGLSLKANATGRGTLAISCAHARLALNIWAARYAGSIARAAPAAVTGVSVPRSILSKAALLAARGAALAEPGAQIRIGAPVVQSPLPAGQSAAVTVPVEISGPDLITRSSEVPVSLVNQAAAAPGGEPQVLLISNNPERLRTAGLWYQASLEPQRPARFLYHHLNATGARAALIVEIENPSPSPARVHIIEGIGGPSRHEIYAGHMAVRQFLSHQSNTVGYVAALPGASRYAAVVQYMAPLEVASGVAEFRLLDAVPLRLSLRLAGPQDAFLLAEAARVQASPLAASAVFPNPRKKLEGTYTLGGRWLFLSVGRDPIQNDHNGASLAGNYGVTYDIRVEIANPSDHAERAEIVMSASAGAAQGVFLVDGAQVETGLLRPYEESQITQLIVPAASTRAVNIKTMPQPGSNYPIRIIARPAVASR